MRAPECTIAEATSSQPFFERLKRIPDPRQRRGQRYRWETLLLVICAAVLSGQQTGAAIAQWIVEHAADWQAWTPTVAGRVPSAATVRRALRRVDVDQVEQVLGDWVEDRVKAPGNGAPGNGAPGNGAPGNGAPAALPLRAVAIDGKALRGAQTHGAQVHLVSLVTHAQALTLAQCAVEAKHNEIPAVQQLLQGRDLHGWVVTLDAMHTQRATAELILRQGGHYLMVVKQNQPTLSTELAEWFACPAEPDEQEHVVETTDKAHGRLEHRLLRGRRLTRCGQVDWLAFPGARQGLARSCWARVRSSGQERAALTYGLTYGLTSLAPEQADLATLETFWRGHWTIENQAHYVRDVTCREDAGQAWVGQTPQALAALRNGALALFRLAGWTNMAAAFRHVDAAVTRAFTLLGCSPPQLVRL